MLLNHLKNNSICHLSPNFTRPCTGDACRTVGVGEREFFDDFHARVVADAVRFYWQIRHRKPCVLRH